MNITLFGGSFNPPHLGHQIIIQQAFELMPNTKQLWLLPDYQHTFAKNTHLASPQHRLNLTQMLQEPNIKTCPIAIDYKTSGETYEILKLFKSEKTYLKEKMHLSNFALRNSKFSFLMGSDQLNNFTKWQHWQQLLKTIPFYIYPRPGYPLKPLHHNMHPLQSPNQIITNISSTLIRHRLKKNLPVNYLVSNQILTYLKQNKLYSRML